MAAVRLFKRTACFALSGFMWHSTATWCALWAAANLQDSCRRARGCVWMEEYLVSLLHARWNLGGLDKCTVTILYTSKVSGDGFCVFLWISVYYLGRAVRSHFGGLVMLPFVFILVFIKPPPHTSSHASRKQNKTKTSQTQFPPTSISQPVCLSSMMMISRTDSPILILWSCLVEASFMALINFFLGQH